MAFDALALLGGNEYLVQVDPWMEGIFVLKKLGEDFLVLSAQKCPVVYFHFQQLLEAGAKSDFTKDQVQFSENKQQYFTITLFF